MRTFALRDGGAIHAGWDRPPVHAGTFGYTLCGREGYGRLANWRQPICRACLAVLYREHIDPRHVFGWHPEFGGKEGE